MKKNTSIVAIIAIVAAVMVAGEYFAYKADQNPEPEITATSTTQVRDEQSFILRPNMVDEYDDWIKYVDIMEGDMIYIRVTKPVYPDPGNDRS